MEEDDFSDWLSRHLLAGPSAGSPTRRARPLAGSGLRALWQRLLRLPPLLQYRLRRAT
jgi:hypothetical protein